MENRDLILPKVTEIFGKVFGDPNIVISREMTAQNVQKWDSLTHIDMIVAVEEEFSIRFNTKQISQLKNVGDLLDLIESKCQ